MVSEKNTELSEEAVKLLLEDRKKSDELCNIKVKNIQDEKDNKENKI